MHGVEFARNGAVYLRMGKADRGDVHLQPLAAASRHPLYPVRVGRTGGPAFLATGAMVKTALQLADTQVPDASVWSVPFLKPLDHQGADRDFTEL